ncbi:hypothetical protein [Microbulbifer sp. DLAB2-AA]|uniref:hypothetical protein n=1 Tax=unclassified Microbulbifer TaxID=2619833 RepID=UPI00403A8DF4
MNFPKNKYFLHPFRNLTMIICLSVIASCDTKLPKTIDLDLSTKEKQIANVNILTTNYLCGFYKEKTGGFGSQVSRDEHYNVARLFARSIYAKLNKKESPQEFEVQTLVGINQRLIKHGPDKLRKEIEDTLSGDYAKDIPRWVNNCSSLYTYSIALIEDASNAQD